MEKEPKAVTGEGNAPRVIRKAYMTLAQAERAHFKLYSQFDSVKLIESRRFKESGYYTWEVQGEIERS